MLHVVSTVKMQIIFNKIEEMTSISFLSSVESTNQTTAGTAAGTKLAASQWLATSRLTPRETPQNLQISQDDQWIS